jgi:hypothetical protein
MKWALVILNLAAIFVLFSVNQYARGHHRAEVDWAYQGLVKQGLLDDAKAEEFAQSHKGWHPRKFLESIGNPEEFVQVLFVIGAGACVFNSFGILVLAARKRDRAVEPTPSPIGGSAKPQGSSEASGGPPSVS